MNCTKCNEIISDKQNFCGNCGAKLTYVCKGCGTENHLKNKFCVNCGNKSPDEDEPPPIKEETTTQSLDLKNTPENLRQKLLKESTYHQKKTRKDVTIIFADICGFTELSEKLDPEEVTEIVDGCFKVLTDIVYDYDGIVDKYIGDCIMALFGAPITHENDPERSILCSIEMLNRLSNYNKKLRFPISLSIGINSGTVIAGNIGHDLKFEYTVIGDAVNTAQRISSIATTNQILVSNNIFRRTKDVIDLREVGKFSVKGKKEALTCYEVVKAKLAGDCLVKFQNKAFSKLVGRDREMYLLEDCFKKVKNNVGQIIAVSGDVGVGKTRLIYELKKLFFYDKIRFHWLEGWCFSYNKNRPYHLFEQVIQAFTNNIKLLTKDSRLSHIQTELKKYDKDNNGFYSLESALQFCCKDESFLYHVGKSKIEFISNYINSILMDVTKEAPLIIMLDNLQNIDPSSRIILENFIPFINQCPIFLFATYRLNFSHQWYKHENFIQLNLSNFNEQETIDMIQNILETDAVDKNMGKYFYNKTNGNPLFVEETLSQLIKTGQVKKGQTNISLQDLSRIEIPDTVLGVIGARVDTIPDELKEVMKFSSVIGREFDIDLLSYISELTGLEEKLNELIRNDILFKKDDASQKKYLFKHGLIRDVVYNRILFADLKILHNKVANYYEMKYIHNIQAFFDILAYHYECSENIEKTIEYQKKAANQAIENYNNDIARYYLDKLLAYYKNRPELLENDTETLDLKLKLLKILIAERNFEASEPLLIELKDKIFSGPHNYYKGLLLYEVSKIDKIKFNLEAAELNLNEGLNFLEFESCETTKLEMQHELGVIMRKKKEFSKALEIFSSVYAKSENLGDKNLQAKYLLQIGLIYQEQKNYKLAMKYFYDSLRIRKLLKDKRSLGILVNNLAALYFELKEYPKALQLCEKSLKLSREIGDVEGIITNLHNRADILLNIGEFDKALIYAKKSLDKSEKVGFNEAVIKNNYVLGEIFKKLGQTQQAKDHIRKGLDMAREKQIEEFIKHGQELLTDL